ncbi:MAG: tRNA pseudouridine(13) synthase TruD [Gemmataceae bacterium]
MKVKSLPQDFHVEERTEVVPSAGPFALYRLDKQNLTTHDAIAAIVRRWHLRHDAVSFGGLKDRHATTSQFLTVFQGPPRDLEDRNLRLAFLGHVASRYTSADIRGNFFRITIRDLSETTVQGVLQNANTVRRSGAPNYFDDQRFGSVVGGEFIARLMVLGRFEDALKLALTGEYEFDEPAAKREKKAVRKYWARWEKCLLRIGRGPAQNVIAYLQHHPTDFRGAVTRLWPESQGLYLAAYQSELWNRMLAELIRQRVDESRLLLMPAKTGELPTPRDLNSDEANQLAALMLPLPSARLRYEPEAVWAPLVDKVLAQEGFALNEMKIPGLRKPFFSKGERAGWVRPVDLMAEAEADDRHAGHQKMTLSFELPRGSYATIVIKRLML